jgi:hypothetical protein
MNINAFFEGMLLRLKQKVSISEYDKHFSIIMHRNVSVKMWKPINDQFHIDICLVSLNFKGDSMSYSSNSKIVVDFVDLLYRSGLIGSQFSCFEHVLHQYCNNITEWKSSTGKCSYQHRKLEYELSTLSNGFLLLPKNGNRIEITFTKGRYSITGATLDDFNEFYQLIKDLINIAFPILNKKFHYLD